MAFSPVIAAHIAGAFADDIAAQFAAAVCTLVLACGAEDERRRRAVDAILEKCPLAHAPRLAPAAAALHRAALLGADADAASASARLVADAFAWKALLAAVEADSRGASPLTYLRHSPGQLAPAFRARYQELEEENARRASLPLWTAASDLQSLNKHI